MHCRNSIGAIVAAAFTMATSAAHALDEPKHPNFSSQWIRIGGIQWDPSKPQGLKAGGAADAGISGDL